MGTRFWKVGDLARETGLSIRALHHYEEVGLLIPSQRTESGHRVYSESDLFKLQQILSLKQLGLPLDQIKKCLRGKEWSPLQIVQAHKEKIQQEKLKTDKLFSRLSRLEEALKAKETPSVEELIKTMEMTTMHDKYFTPEQLEKLAKRKQALGDKKIKEVEEAWPKLIEAVRTEMKKKTHPNDAKVQKLAKQWQELVSAFTGGDVEIGLSLREMYKKEPQVGQNFGMDAELSEYVGKMMYCLSQGRT